MRNIMEFEMKSIIEVDIDKLADQMIKDIPFLLHDYQGLTDEELEAIDLSAVQKAIAQKMLEE